MNVNFYAMEMHDVGRIEKLNHLTNLETFHDDVRKLTKNIHSDHSIKRWQCLSDARYNELLIQKVANIVDFRISNILDTMIENQCMGYPNHTEKKLAANDLAYCLDLLNQVFTG